jgi:hypothetical protein
MRNLPAVRGTPGKQAVNTAGWSVQAAKHPDQQQDRERHADQPQKQITAHVKLLSFFK